MVRGRAVCSLWRASFERPGSVVIINIVGQDEAFVAPIRCDVCRLTAEIDVVFGIDLELFRDLTVDFAKARPDPLQMGDGR